MKFKKIPENYFATILDRLTRLEPAYIRYERVFNDIINKFLICENTKKINLEQKINIVEEIFNSSLNNSVYDPYINDILINLEEKYFYFNELSYQYLSARLNILSMLSQIKITKNCPDNLVWLKNTEKKPADLIKFREEYALIYPVEKIILCEGKTEFTLLKTILKLFDFDFDKSGIIVIPAGGKNQVAKKFYDMSEKIKIPFFILLDRDAMQTELLIRPKLREFDKIYLIKSGEFEDLIPHNILKNAVNSAHSNDYHCSEDDLSLNIPNVKKLEAIYRKYGFGEYKKAEFAEILKEYIINNATKEDFATSEVKSIADALQ